MIGNSDYRSPITNGCVSDEQPDPPDPPDDKSSGYGDRRGRQRRINPAGRPCSPIHGALD